jgi:hypothetical protein
MKKCCVCKVEQDETCFYKDKSRKDGLQVRCIMCQKAYKNKHHIHDRQVDKLYKQNIKTSNKDRVEFFKEKFCSRCQKVKCQNSFYKFAYSLDGLYYCCKDCYNERKQNKKDRNIYIQTKRNNDINYKLSDRIRTRLRRAIKNNWKAGSAIKDMGCSVEELKLHLESKFQSGMTWNNWGKDGWHIDHIKPLASFDLTDRKQFLEAVHYTNLQPLWEGDNCSKGSKI